MKCQDLKKAVQESWSFLFTDLRFKILSCQEGDRESASLFAESAACRVRFMSVNYNDELKIDFGPKDAPLDWSPDDDVTTHQDPKWYSLRGLLVYLENKPLDTATLIKGAQETYRNRHRSTQSPPQIEVLAQRARPYIAQIISLFAPDQFERWRERYAQYWLERRL